MPQLILTLFPLSPFFTSASPESPPSFLFACLWSLLSLIPFHLSLLFVVSPLFTHNCLSWGHIFISHICSLLPFSSPFYSSSLFHTELSSVPPFSPPFPLFSCNSSLLQCFATPTSLLARHHCNLVPASLLHVHPDFTLLIWNESALKNISPHGYILQFNPNIS